MNIDAWLPFLRPWPLPTVLSLGFATPGMYGGPSLPPVPKEEPDAARSVRGCAPPPSLHAFPLATGR
ncbi:hypothetical protein [Nonomuraea sp. NPDC003804]|uniref:hypothetical protein n=1 Tax=Nonomuraea sp. NPDC003804 TaxID=3154547 RepID=UPI0033B7DD71